MIIIDLIYNISVLVALSVLSGFINSKFAHNSILSRNLQGLLFGAVAIIGMLYPFNLTQGIFFDGRSIVISLCTLFFGPLSGFIASTISIIFRNIIGGEGALTGSLVITSSFLIGLLFYGLRSKKRIDLTNLNLYIFGFIVSAAMMFFMITLPRIYMLEALNTVTLTVMIFYPLITLLIGKVLLDQEENKENIYRISEERNLYKTTIYSIGDGLIVIDKSGKIVQMNQIAENLIKLKEKEAIGQPLKSIFLTIGESAQSKIEDGISKDPLYYLDDKTHRKLLLISKSGKEIPISVTNSPIKNTDGSIKGEVIVFSDQTSEIEQQIAVSESEQRFRSIVEGTSEPMFIQSSGKFIYLNPAALVLFGVDHSSELIGKPILERFHSDFHDIIKERIRIINEERKSVSKLVELKCIKANGDEIWVETSGEPIVYDKKNSALVFIRDITERKQIFEKLKASDRIFEHALDMLCIASFDGYFKVLNPSWTITLGWSIDELLSRPWKEFLHPSDLSYTSSIVENIVMKNEIIQFENRYICMDGSYRWLSWRVIPYPEEEVIYGVARDVTLQKNAEHALHQSEEKLLSIFNSAPTGIGVTFERIITEVNQKICDMTGYTKEELIGNSTRILYASNEEFELVGKAKYNKSLPEVAAVIETQWIRKDRRIIDVLLAAIPIVKDDFTKGITFTALDITEKKKTEKELNQYRKYLEQIVEERTEELDNLNRSLLEQLEREKELEEQLQIALSKEKEINELKTRFIATVSHEFRTPLASLLSSSQMIQRYSSKWTEEKLNEHYNRISSTVQYLTQLLDDVLTISRADREILTNNPEKINISEQLNLFYQELESYLKESHKLVFNYLSEQESILIDKKLFRQIIVNLLTNAIKYSPEGGIIELVIDYKENYLHISVKDEGIGIAEDEIKFIFDPFYRTKNSIGIQGSGLGLNIVFRAVEILGGNISAESKLNNGTKFLVRIPLYE